MKKSVEKMLLYYYEEAYRHEEYLYFSILFAYLGPDNQDAPAAVRNA